MSAIWYDSMSEKWRPMPKPPAPVQIHQEPEDIYETARRRVREANLWAAVTATSTSTLMAAPVEDAEEEPCCF